MDEFIGNTAPCGERVVKGGREVFIFVVMKAGLNIVVLGRRSAESLSTWSGFKRQLDDVTIGVLVE